MERCSSMGLGMRHDGSHRRWSDWVDLVRQIPTSERVVWSLCTATLMFKQASQPGENS